MAIDLYTAATPSRVTEPREVVPEQQQQQARLEGWRSKELRRSVPLNRLNLLGDEDLRALRSETNLAFSLAHAAVKELEDGGDAGSGRWRSLRFRRRLAGTFRDACDLELKARKQAEISRRHQSHQTALSRYGSQRLGEFFALLRQEIGEEQVEQLLRQAEAQLAARGINRPY